MVYVFIPLLSAYDIALATINIYVRIKHRNTGRPDPYYKKLYDVISLLYFVRKAILGVFALITLNIFWFLSKNNH